MLEWSLFSGLYSEAGEWLEEQSGSCGPALSQKPSSHFFETDIFFKSFAQAKNLGGQNWSCVQICVEVLFNVQLFLLNVKF